MLTSVMGLLRASMEDWKGGVKKAIVRKSQPREIRENGSRLGEWGADSSTKKEGRSGSASEPSGKVTRS